MKRKRLPDRSKEIKDLVVKGLIESDCSSNSSGNSVNMVDQSYELQKKEIRPGQAEKAGFLFPTNNEEPKPREADSDSDRDLPAPSRSASQTSVVSGDPDCNSIQIRQQKTTKRSRMLQSS